MVDRIPEYGPQQVLCMSLWVDSQQAAARKGTGWKRREAAKNEVDVHARCKPDSKAEGMRREEEEEE